MILRFCSKLATDSEITGLARTRMESHHKLCDIRQGDIPQLIILLLATLHWTTFKPIIPQLIIATLDYLDENPEGYHRQGLD